MSTDASDWQRSRRDHRDPPSRRRGRRLPEVHRLRLSSPSAERDPDRACAFGRELQSAGGRHREASELADHGSKSAMAKTFLHAGEHGLVVSGLDVDYPVGDEPRLCDRRREQVRPCDAPEDLASGSGSDACAE